ncbi:MAG: gamma-glutamyltransferase [Bdellovibrionales bacterium]|nr:gamma-glutamyltransferase [Bdellovibrionales bacterium]
MKRRHLGALFVFIFGVSCGIARKTPELDPIDPKVREVPLESEAKVSATGRKWIVSTQGDATTQIAAKILKEGGNLMDAAVAASFAISVERPHSTGIGGGGFLLFHEAKTRKTFAFDFRERAPRRARSDMFLNEKGEVIPDLSVTGAKSIAVPGLVRGLKTVHSRFGKLPWGKVVEPAARLAERGFFVYPALSIALREERADLEKFPAAKKIFLHEDGSPLQEGERLIQRDLAATLRRIAKNPEDFYIGAVGKKIVDAIRSEQGILDELDLATYSTKERSPLSHRWKGYQVVSMPPPSSGGIHVIQILKMLENDPLPEWGYQSIEAEHRIATAMQFAFADRAKFLADPDFVKVPVHSLLSEGYLEGRRQQFDPERALRQKDVSAGLIDAEKDHFETTHMSLMDREGNAIVTTQTINSWFGSKMVAEGTGVVLNNEMDDFSAKVGASNLFGATAVSDANRIEAGKTPLSSMSPTLIFKDGKPVLALGAPGGTRIITSVAQTILNYLVFGKSLYESVAAFRLHQQWSPDELKIENLEVPAETLRGLSRMGWKIKRTPNESNVMAVAREGDVLRGVSDPRDAGTSAGGF